MNLSRRFAGASGIVFVLLSVAIAVVAPPIPSLATSGPDVVAYFAKNQDSFLIGNYLGALGLLPGIIVILYLIVAIRDAEPERGFSVILLVRPEPKATA
jgi:hypothetical protein